MNQDSENKAYPCDEPEEQRSYPCDTEETFFDAANTENTPAFGKQEEVPQRKGKGRRGGNAAASIVVHSGKFKEPRRRYEGTDREDRGDRTEGRERFNARSEGHGNREHFQDKRRFEQGGFGERNRDRFRDGSGRDGRYRDERAGYRGGRNSFSKDSPRKGRAEREKAPESAFGKSYTLPVISTSEIGAFVEAPAEILERVYGRRQEERTRVLIPFAEQIGRPRTGDEVKVFFYEDKGGRLTATMRAPYLQDGEIGILEVAAVTKIGAFLDNGVPKQVLLPFKEQIHKPEVGDEVLVWLYTDKSGRQAASMRVYSHLDRHSPYHEDDRVTGFVYEVNPELGVFVAVDNKYYGMVPIRETFKNYAYGDEVEARVARVREDGKLDLLIRDKLYKTVQEDADVILYELKRNNGFLPYGDRADAAFIEETYAMSKNQFKRALGHLYKNHVVELDRVNDTVRLL